MFAEANAFVARHHRHHRPVVGTKFCVAVADAGEVVGVALIGRPVARALDDGWVLEVNRCCTDGTANACSMLYAAAWRAARALGYRKLITYTLPEEGGASLRGAGWRLVAQTDGGSWGCPSRPRVDTHPTQGKLRWESV
ncbi:putative phage protein [Cupriavidus oxalaticus]|nr:putative phage protein [Cupriavidus oxalaticus]